MKVNKTLTKLNLSCIWNSTIDNKWIEKKVSKGNNEKWTGNKIGNEGACAIGESLMMNSSLTDLNLSWK